MMVGVTDLGIAGIGDATLIASGGSALVYMAETDDGRPVAVKVLRGMHGSEVTRRFRRERAASALLQEHPAIIEVYEDGLTTAGEPYLVMPLHGGSLQDELEEKGRCAVREAVDDVVAAARAVDYAHQRGVLHRDIKPGNLLRTLDGSIVVTDFGIARVRDAGITSATVGATTPLYAAPELLAENEASVQSEVYALGATTYALLAGRAAFADSENIWSTMTRIREEAPAEIDDVPAPIMRVVMQAMSKHPTERPAGAGLYASYLQAAVDADVDWEPPRPLPSTDPLPAPAPPLVPVVRSQAPLARSEYETVPLVAGPPTLAFDIPLDPPDEPPETLPDEPDEDRPSSPLLTTVASIAAIALIGALAWWGINSLLGDDTSSDTAREAPVDSSLPPPDNDLPDETPPPTVPPEPEPDPTPTTRLVSFTGDHFTAFLPAGWAVVSQDVDVGYGFRSRFIADDMYLNVDTTPDFAEAGATDIATSARDIAASISSASPVQTEEVDGLTLHSFTFVNNQGIESIDIFFEVDGDGYAIVAGSITDPATAFSIARQVALSVRGTPPV